MRASTRRFSPARPPEAPRGGRAARFAYGHEGAAGFQRAFEDNGGEIVQKLWPPLNATDYGTFIAQIHRADQAERRRRLRRLCRRERLALNNASNVIEYYRGKGENVQVEVVANGPGLNMLREDTSPVKDRMKRLKDFSFPENITFSACNNTRKSMEKAEGHPIAIIPQARVVPSGVVRLMELQEEGWSYIRP